MTYTPEEIDRLFKEIFEDDRRGAAILEVLRRQFNHGASSRMDEGGMYETFARAHQRKVIDYIAARINRANGAQEGETEE